MVLRPLRPALAWALLILVLCLTPGNALPSWDWADLISMDKLIHAVIFGVLVFLLFKGFEGQDSASFLSRNAIPLAVSISVLYGGTMELMQQIPVLGRRGDWNDAIANTVGALAAWGWVRWRANKERERTEAMDV